MPPAKKTTKKSEAAESPASAEPKVKAGAKAQASKATAAKPGVKPAPKQAKKTDTPSTHSTPAVPMIDTSGAAAAAARMVKAGLGASGAGGAARPQSAAFTQMKDSIGKPGAASVAGFLNSTAPTKQNGGLPFGGSNKQVGRNQTFGADVNRAGVPRRTGG